MKSKRNILKNPSKKLQLYGQNVINGSKKTSESKLFNVLIHFLLWRFFSSSYYTWQYQGIPLADSPIYRPWCCFRTEIFLLCYSSKEQKDSSDTLNTLQFASQISSSLPLKTRVLEGFSINKSSAFPLLYIPSFNIVKTTLMLKALWWQ